jgi:hypothetical protein
MGFDIFLYYTLVLDLRFQELQLVQGFICLRFQTPHIEPNFMVFLCQFDDLFCFNLELVFGKSDGDFELFCLGGFTDNYNYDALILASFRLMTTSL